MEPAIEEKGRSREAGSMITLSAVYAASLVGAKRMALEHLLFKLV